MKKTMILFLLVLCSGCMKHTNSESDYGECYLIKDSNSRLCIGFTEDKKQITYINAIVSYDLSLIQKITGDSQPEAAETFYKSMIEENTVYKKEDQKDGFQDFWEVTKLEKYPSYSSHFDDISINEVPKNYYYQEIVDFRFHQSVYDEAVMNRWKRYGLYSNYHKQDNSFAYDELKQNAQFKYHYFFTLGEKVNVLDEFTPTF